MFDFEKLDLYQVIREQNTKVLKFILEHGDIDSFIREEWKKASFNIVLNLAEGTGRMVNIEKKSFFTNARGSVFEAVAILDIAHQLELVDKDTFQDFYDGYEKISKMLLGMIRSYSQQ
ncbi:MAG: four helix bundle protein [Bacteroidales bacterium]|nr:four helix bundle protein [Bacteroidales bacterium]